MSRFALHSVYTDNMVFQRGLPIRIAGTGPAGFPVAVTFADESRTVEVGGDGEWSAEFPPMEAATGLVITAKCRQFTYAHVRRNVAVGELWFCGGQSNMEYPVRGQELYSLADGAKVAAEASDLDIRILFVPYAISPDGPCRDFSAPCRWELGNDPDAVGRASAVGYLFAQHIRRKTGVPVGIVSSNWGGCRIEPWIPEASIVKNKLAMELAMISELRGGHEKERRQVRARLEKDFKAWLGKFNSFSPRATKNALAGWAKPDADVSEWAATTTVQLASAQKPGVIWYRREVELPRDWKAAGTMFHADFIKDCDEVFWDGVKIGETTTDVESYPAAPRNYPVPASAAKPGGHVLAMRIQNHFKRAALEKPAVVSGAKRVDLFGPGVEWLERVEFHLPESFPVRPPTTYSVGLMSRRHSIDFPSTMFNAMLAPAMFLRFGGTIWYQGCANSNEYRRYGKQQKALVEGLRDACDSPDMAFIQVELAGFQRNTPKDRLPDDFWKDREPSDGNFSRMRMVQEEIRKIRRCAIASAVDIGDHSYIHPANKREVARRLAAIAGKLCYGEKGAVEGPIYSETVRDGSTLRVRFANIGKGLCIKGGRSFGPHAFAIAPARGRFVWAKARLEGDEVVVWSDNVKDPARVRYAWDSYPPSMRLFNKDGYPATPFSGSSLQ